MRPSILVLAGDPFACERWVRFLRAENYKIHFAETGLDALEKLRKIKIDLLLLDFGFTGHDGWGTLELLAYVGSALPVIIITGQSISSSENAFTMKELKLPQLLQTIRDLADQSPGISEWAAPGAELTAIENRS